MKKLIIGISCKAKDLKGDLEKEEMYQLFLKSKLAEDFTSDIEEEDPYDEYINYIKKKYKRSNKYMLCLDYKDIGDLIEMVEEGLKSKVIPTYKLKDERVVISDRLYSGLVRSLAWKIEFEDRLEKALSYIDNFDSLDSEQFYCLNRLLRGE